MTDRELFGVVVRSFGLVCWVWSFGCFLWAFLTGANLVPLDPLVESTRGYFLQGVALFLVGWFLLRNAKDFVRFAYHDGEEGGEDQM